jgi:Domain of unknown function (DUF6471)
MATPKSEEEWALRVRTYLKQELRDADVTYVELAKRLKKYGFKETEASITNKLKRGTFAATFFAAALVAIGCEAVRLEDI